MSCSDTVSLCEQIADAEKEYAAVSALLNSAINVMENSVGLKQKTSISIELYHRHMVEVAMSNLQTLGQCKIPQCDKHKVMVEYNNSKRNNKRPRVTPQSPDEFRTDNDGFKTVGAKRAAKHTTILSSDPSIPTSNSFQAIADDTTEVGIIDIAPGNNKKIHPIMIKLVSNIKEMCSTVEAVVDDVEFKLQGEYIRAHVKTAEKYRAVIHCLRENGFGYYISDPVKDRPIKAVIKGLPRDTDCNEIVEELRGRGFLVDRVTQLKRLRDRQPLPMFQVQLRKNEVVDTIYNIKKFLHLTVQVEKFIRPNRVNQCYQCQGFGHSSSVCNIGPKCVKCGEGHHSNTCTKPRDTPAKCANCGGPHPASYRGCDMFPKPKPHRNHTNVLPPRTQYQGQQNTRREGVNYAQVVYGPSRLRIKKGCPNQIRSRNFSRTSPYTTPNKKCETTLAH